MALRDLAPGLTVDDVVAGLPARFRRSLLGAAALVADLPDEIQATVLDVERSDDGLVLSVSVRLEEKAPPGLLLAWAHVDIESERAIVCGARALPYGAGAWVLRPLQDSGTADHDWSLHLGSRR